MPRNMRPIKPIRREKTPNLIKDPKEIADKTKTIKSIYANLKENDRLRLLRDLGVGTSYFTCQRCGKVKPKQDFYLCTIIEVESGVTNICKECAENVAMPLDVNGNKTEPTKETIDRAMYLLDKPMLESVWDAVTREHSSKKSRSKDLYHLYIQDISSPPYYTYSYRASDGYTSGALSLKDTAEKNNSSEEQEIINQFEKNKNDTLRLLGYLPFENEKLITQPFLYSQLIGFLDASEEGNDDMMRIQSIISIVRGFAQASLIDDCIAKLSSDMKIADTNVTTIKIYQTMKRDLMSSIVNLAKENCISLKNSKNSIKGENTWTGKIKKIKDLNLREGEVNTFDIGTCEGMRQVQEISDASIMKQLALDESEWSDMVATMRVDMQELRRQRDSYKEINRLLLKENIDLKDYMEENGLRVNFNLVDLKDLYSPFASMEEDEGEEEFNDDDYEEENYEEDEGYEEDVEYSPEEEVDSNEESEDLSTD